MIQSSISLWLWDGTPQFTGAHAEAGFQRFGEEEGEYVRFNFKIYAFDCRRSLMSERTGLNILHSSEYVVMCAWRRFVNTASYFVYSNKLFKSFKHKILDNPKKLFFLFSNLK